MSKQTKQKEINKQTKKDMNCGARTFDSVL